MKTVKTSESLYHPKPIPKGKKLVYSNFTPRQVKIVYCLACGVNPVDSLGGYDICPDCVGKL